MPLQPLDVQVGYSFASNELWANSITTLALMFAGMICATLAAIRVFGIGSK